MVKMDRNSATTSGVSTAPVWGAALIVGGFAVGASIAGEFVFESIYDGVASSGFSFDPPRDFNANYSYLGNINSSNMPGLIGPVGYGYETNALDVIGDQAFAANGYGSVPVSERSYANTPAPKSLDLTGDGTFDAFDRILGARKDRRLTEQQAAERPAEQAAARHESNAATNSPHQVGDMGSVASCTWVLMRHRVKSLPMI